MKISVRVFSFLRENLSVATNERGEAELELPDGATLKDLFLTLGIDRQMKDDLFSGSVQRAFQVMIDGQVIYDFAYKLQTGQQVILFPPMSGGQ
ncbi:MAG: hypothetical protein Kow0088_24930 [Anaerolineales bacterium]